MFPARLWWDEDCTRAKSEMRASEKRYRKWKAREAIKTSTHGTAAMAPECVLEDGNSSKQVGATMRKDLRAKLHNFYRMKKSKELRSRVEQRNRLLEAKGSKEFWKQVMIFEFDRLTQVLHDKAKVRNLATNLGLDMSVAKRHFEAISVPPVCAWFDDVFYDHIQRVIDASIEGLSGNLGCEWVSDDESSQGESYIDQDISDSTVRNANQKINKRISLDEYRTAKEKMHKGKTVGPDGIPIECILGVRCENTNQLVSPIDDIIVRVFNIILGSGQYPEAWRVALLRPLIKGSTFRHNQP